MPRRTAPSRPIGPRCAPGHATVSTGSCRLPPAIACAPNPYPRRRITATIGTRNAAPATSIRDARRTSDSASAAGPTMYPGQSISDTTGNPNASHNCSSRAALSEAAAVIAPAVKRVSLAMMPTARPSMRANAVTISRANRGRRNVTDSSSASVSMIGATS